MPGIHRVPLLDLNMAKGERELTPRTPFSLLVIAEQKQNGAIN
jgi:hypothetical protein